MEDYRKEDSPDFEKEDSWEEPKILIQGKIEARLFSDEPDPWGGP